MKWKEFARDYLSFSRRERIAGLIIFLLILLFIFIPSFLSEKTNPKKSAYADTAWIGAAKKLEIKEPEEQYKQSPGNQAAENDNSYQYDRPVGASAPAILFYFDPNTLDKAGWEKLGLREKTIHTIQNYLGKGGHFYKPVDLKKIYGLQPSDYFRLEPYIRIESNKKEDESVEYVRKENETRSFAPKIIDINTADTTSFISLPGIGSKLAARIINFRDKLGGFYSVNQIAETYGLPDSTFQKIKQYLKPGNTSVKKININTATVDELKAHPYIKYSLANPIISYRNEHGLFSKIEDIKKVMAVTDDVYNKIAPYLAL